MSECRFPKRRWTALFLLVALGVNPGYTQEALFESRPVTDGLQPADAYLGDPAPQGLGTSADAATRFAESGKVDFKPIGKIQADFRIDLDRIPTDVSQTVFRGSRRPAAISPTITEFHWTATNFFHYPLYFDDTPLERYGQTLCPPLQPVISGTRFFMTLPIMPYKIGVRHPWECVTTSGLMRPGECVPCVRERLTVDCGGTLMQTGTVLAMVFLLP